MYNRVINSAIETSFNLRFTRRLTPRGFLLGRTKNDARDVDGWAQLEVKGWDLGGLDLLAENEDDEEDFEPEDF